ncbi:MAG: hypothetical protein IJ859_05865, partial [Synergistaceae bacterium]|nr:hypothetical protein [Synergistaceae bacterium]
TSTDYLLDGNNAPTLPDNELTSSIEHKEKRLIIKNRDIHIDLPETEESFEIIRRFFDMQANKNGSE